MIMKAIFFDIDGTLIEGTHPDYRYMSEKVQNAIRKLQEQGHYVFIDSGRSIAFLDNGSVIFFMIRLFIERHLKNLLWKK